ncbi:MAG: metalloregulator ArsR/SmtB family transcription factor [Nitrospirota bacterium]
MQRILLIFKALSEETRLRILKLLENCELCVCDITDVLNMTQPNISFHLGMLKEAGIIKDRREGRWMHYSLDESDVFIRFLLLGVLEKFKDKLAEKDRERLIGLLSAKEECRIVSISGRIRRGRKC